MLIFIWPAYQCVYTRTCAHMLAYTVYVGMRVRRMQIVQLNDQQQSIYFIRVT